MTQRIFTILTLLITVCPFVVFAMFYENLPQQVVLFMDLKGNPSLTTDKSLFSVLRLPMMGVMIQVACFTMASVKPENKKITNRRMWLYVAFLAALKMSLSSLEVLTYSKLELFNFLRITILIIIGIAVFFLILHVYSLYRADKNLFNGYLTQVTGIQKVMLALSFTGYLLLVLFPFIL